MYKYAKHCGAKKLSRLKSLTSAVIHLKKNPIRKINAIALARKFKFSEDQAAKMLGMDLKVYRSAPKNKILSWATTENVLRLAELFEIGTTTFDGNSKSFVKWLNTHVHQLNDFKPIQVLESGIGIEVVKSELLRMEHSVI